jgi:hypothetical protein
VNGSAVTFKYPSVLQPERQPRWRRGHLTVVLGARNAGAIELEIDNTYRGTPAPASVRASVHEFDSAIRTAYGTPVHGVVETHGGLAAIDYRQIPRRRATDPFREAYVFVGPALYRLDCAATTWNDGAMTRACANALESLRPVQPSTASPTPAQPGSARARVGCGNFSGELNRLAAITAQLEHTTAPNQMLRLTKRLERLQEPVTNAGLLNCALQLIRSH